MAGTLHMHVTSWLLALVLFVVGQVLHQRGKERAGKIVKMILRLFYLLIIATGIMLLNYLAEINRDYIVKIVFGLLVITFLELILVRVSKGKSTTIYWLLLAAVFIYTLYLGYSLPL